MNHYKNASFVTLLIRFTIVFFIVVFLIKTVMGFFQFEGIEGLKNAYFIEGKWQLFIKRIGVMSLIYGVLMTIYYKFIKK